MASGTLSYQFRWDTIGHESGKLPQRHDTLEHAIMWVALLLRDPINVWIVDHIVLEGVLDDPEESSIVLLTGPELQALAYALSAPACRS